MVKTRYKIANLPLMRSECALTQAELAHKAGLSVPTISAAEQGDTVTLSTAKKLMKALGRKLDEAAERVVIQ